MTFPSEANAPFSNTLGTNSSSYSSTPTAPDAKDVISQHPQAQNIVFIDRALSEIETLTQSINDAKVVFIDSTESGVAKITETLAQYQNLASVQIFSHGEAAELTLGNSQLSAETLDQNSDALTEWGKALSAKGDVLFFGCDVGAGAKGRAFIDDLSGLIDADIAASSDLTGRGGDWDLEVTAGSIEAKNAVGADAKAAYAGTMSLLQNGSFESKLTGWAKFDGREQALPGGTAGEKALTLSNKDEGTGQIIEAKANETYQLTGKAKTSASGYSAIGMTFMDADYQPLKSASGEAIASNDWKTYQAQDTAPEDTAFVQVWTYRGDSGGEVVIDDLSLTTENGSAPTQNSPVVEPENQPAEPVAEAPINQPTQLSASDNLLTNSSFDSSLADWISFSGAERISTGALELATANSGTAQTLSAASGESYNLSATAKSSNGDGFLGFNFLDASGNRLGREEVRLSSPNWQTYQLEGTAPAGTISVQVWTYKNNQEGSAFVDEMALVSGDRTNNPPENTPNSPPPVPENPPAPEPTPAPSVPITSSDVQLSIKENENVVAQLKGQGNGLNYAITGGADADLFAVNSQTGELSFKAAPDYESARDRDTNNTYDLEVRSTNNAGETNNQTIAVEVTNEVSVFLLGGQSNMVGLGIDSELPANLKTPLPDVQIWDTQSFTDLTPGFANPNGLGGFGPELTFGQGINGATQEEVYLIKYGEGATSLAFDWNPKGDNNPQYDKFVSTVSQGLNAIEAAGSDYSIEGMLWMQGETDTAYPGTYEANLTAFISDMRSRYGKDLEFAIGKLSPTFSGDVTIAQEKVAAADPKAYIVDTDSFQLKDDRVHYNTKGQIDLGYAFADAFS